MTLRFYCDCGAVLDLTLMCSRFIPESRWSPAEPEVWEFFNDVCACGYVLTKQDHAGLIEQAMEKATR